MLRAMDEYHDRYSPCPAGHHQTPREHRILHRKTRLHDIKEHPRALHAVEPNAVGPARSKGDANAIGPVGPAKRAGPAAVACARELTGGAVLAAPPQLAFLSATDVDFRSLREAVRSDMTVGLAITIGSRGGVRRAQQNPDNQQFRTEFRGHLVVLEETRPTYACGAMQSRYTSDEVEQHSTG